MTATFEHDYSEGPIDCPECGEEAYLTVHMYGDTISIECNNCRFYYQEDNLL